MYYSQLTKKWPPTVQIDPTMLALCMFMLVVNCH